MGEVCRVAWFELEDEEAEPETIARTAVVDKISRNQCG